MSPSERTGREPSHLRAVPSADAAPAPGSPGPLPPPGPSAPRSRTALLLAIALLAAVVGLAVESRRAARLGAQVSALEGELTAARLALDAHRQRLAEARHHVSDLRGRVEILDALLATEPGGPPAAAPPAAPTPPPAASAPR